MEKEVVLKPIPNPPVQPTAQFTGLGKQVTNFYKFSDTTGILKDETNQAFWFEYNKSLKKS